MAYDDTKVDDLSGLPADEWNAMVAKLGTPLQADGSIVMTGNLDCSEQNIKNCLSINGYPAYPIALPLALKALDSDATIKTNINLYGSSKILTSATDNDTTLGRATYRWSDIYGVTFHEGDVAFSETFCVKCNKDFKVSDNIIMKVIKIENKEVYTIPIHYECNDKPKKKFTRQEAVKETIYVHNEKKNKIEAITQNKTQKIKYIKNRLKKGFTIKDGKVYKGNVIYTLSTATEPYTEIEDEVVYQDVEYEV